MADSAGFPLHRPEIRASLERGEAAIARAMSAQPPKLFEAGKPILDVGEAHELIYRLRTGWAARSRSRTRSGFGVTSARVFARLAQARLRHRPG